MVIYIHGMQNFHDYFFGLSMTERDRYAAEVGTSVLYLERLAGGFRLPSVRMAKRLITASRGAISFDSIVETWEAKHGPL